MDEYCIEMKDIVMEFGGIKVLNKVDFHLKKGEVRGLAGKNGAGKSTLMKIIHGIYTQTSGSISFSGKDIRKSASIKDREKIVSMIFQDYSLAGDLTVAQNIFLNSEPQKIGLIDDTACIERASSFFKEIGVVINPQEKVKNLSTGDMQLVEIAKAIMKDTSIILMDEPTAALDVEATAKFFSIVSKLKEKGFSIIICTHHLKHIIEICDSITVIRDGEVSLDAQIQDVTLERVISSMLGEMEFQQRKNRVKKKIDRTVPLLSVVDIASKIRPIPVSFNLYPGEVVGLVGLKGSGRTEIYNNIYGIDPITSGSIKINGKAADIKSPESAIQQGIFLVPENRHTQGLSLIHTLYDNLLLPIIGRLTPKLLVQDKKGVKIADDAIQTMGIKTSSIYAKVSDLSGGNQQKIVVGKALISDSKVILMDDPMYGIDIHAKVEISSAIERYTNENNAVLFVSSELSEILENCDRILIVKQNRIAGEIANISELTEDSLMAAIQ
jgi:ribose transport system ATP-binding protein